MLPRRTASYLLGVALSFGLISPSSAQSPGADRSYERIDYVPSLILELSSACQAAQPCTNQARLAMQGDADIQFAIGVLYDRGESVVQDFAQALDWYHRAALQGHSRAQNNLGVMYRKGRGVARDDSAAAKWYRLAAEHGDSVAQNNLGWMYERGLGVKRNLVLAHAWYSLATTGSVGAAVHDAALANRDLVARFISLEETREAQRIAREWTPGKALSTPVYVGPTDAGRSADLGPMPRLKVESTATGFAVTLAGDVLTNYHAVENCDEVRAGPADRERLAARLVAADPTNDLALLRLSTPTAAAASFRDGRSVRSGDLVVAIGFPLRGLLASAANVTTGVVSAVAGLGNDTRFLQVTAPVQPGNSGGPLLDQSGNVIGIVVGKLDALLVAEATGDIPQNVNFALHASVARTFLEANGVTYERAASTTGRPPADIGEQATRFTVVVECWNRASEVTRGRE